MKCSIRVGIRPVNRAKDLFNLSKCFHRKAFLLLKASEIFCNNGCGCIHFREKNLHPKNKPRVRRRIKISTSSYAK
jgi:hypothetical protein